jgi:hypothetical protein
MTIDEHKIYPGPMKDDSHFYGPLQLPPKVDFHPEGKSIADATAVLIGCDCCLTRRPPFFSFSNLDHPHVAKTNGKKHPEFGASRKKSSDTYSPFDLPPKV